DTICKHNVENNAPYITFLNDTVVFGINLNKMVKIMKNTKVERPQRNKFHIHTKPVGNSIIEGAYLKINFPNTGNINAIIIINIKPIVSPIEIVFVYR